MYFDQFLSEDKKIFEFVDSNDNKIDDSWFYDQQTKEEQDEILLQVIEKIDMNVQKIGISQNSEIIHKYHKSKVTFNFLLEAEQKLNARTLL